LFSSVGEGHEGEYMKALPDRFESVHQLEEFMSSPSESLVEYFKGFEGDIMVIGAGGKY
jgi:hypothetical protein